MFEARTRRLRLGVVMIAVLAIGIMGAGAAHAAQPFTISITEPVGIDGFTVTMSGTADSPSHTTHHIVIDWGDETTDDIPLGDGPGPWNWGPLEHTFAAGEYHITATIIHASDNGQDQGQSAVDSVDVVVTPPDPCVENPEAEECQTDDDSGETPPPTVTPTPPPADKPEVLGETKKPLAKTASPATAALWTAIIVLMIGATVRYCAVEPATTVAIDSERDDLVAKTLDLVNRMVHTRK
jgi:hypothetical protein